MKNLTLKETTSVQNDEENDKDAKDKEEDYESTKG